MDIVELIRVKSEMLEKAIDEIARLRAEAEALQKRNDALVDLSNHVDKLYRDAKAEAEANRVDAERLDFLEGGEGDGHFQLTSLGNGKKIFDVEVWREGVLLDGTDWTLRAAIDAARGKDNG